ncbi:efflux RND transporter periplasmic adaptor subunit [Labrys wisconsinensis]|uniref:RND family efflux transporter MFP subunit n=1 Tax=Labrys wisconsinensis TaxID=425677 RepID=A0ABU0J2H5_9HYPH|nr:HlyD family secretion protein [Labrys wisconsinensis]MDQ0467417.1 RND family efflux transporter MFP subunit [Labrys wisconsinensis]
MKRFLSVLGRVLLTLVVVAAAAGAGWRAWDTYMNEPWTRDGHVRADVVGVTPDVSGLVSEVLVRDNQAVHRGDVLLRIDRQRFELALQLAEAAVAGQKASLDQARRDAVRYQQLGRDVASQQKIEQAQAAQATAEASYAQALANRDIARLNLERSEIHAPANGIITNMSLNPGDYVTAGKAVMALVDSDSLRVEGYFEETRLARIRLGDPVEIHLMGQAATLTGRVESIAGGIEDRERSDGSSLMASINPTFSWVRLAQRVPIRIKLDPVPEGVRLVAGLTATVAVKPAG